MYTTPFLYEPSPTALEDRKGESTADVRGWQVVDNCTWQNADATRQRTTAAASLACLLTRRERVGSQGKPLITLLVISGGVLCGTACLRDADCHFGFKFEVD